MDASASKQDRRVRAFQPGPVRARSLTARALNAVGWSYVAGFVFLLSQVAYTAFTARLVGPAAYGGYALALTIVALAGLVGVVGLADSVMRAHELTERGARTALTLAVGSGLVLSVVLIALSAPIGHWFGAPGTARVLRLLALQPPMLAAAGVSYGLLRRGQRYKAASLIDLTSSLVGFAVGAAAVASGMGAPGLALGQVARGAVAMLVGLFWARVSLRPAWDRAMAREFSAFSGQVAGQNLGHYAIGSLPLWSVARLAGGAATGLFSRASQLIAFPADQFTNGLMRAAYPLYREVSSNNERTRRALTDALVLTSAACAVAFGVFAVFVQPAALLLLGARWYAAAEITPLLCAFAAVTTLYSVLASAAEALRWMRMIWITQLIFLVVMGALLFVASGQLVATVIAMIIANIVAHVFMLAWTSLRGLVHIGETIKAYLVHSVLGLVIAVVPPLVSSLVVGEVLVPSLCLRVGILAVIGLALWAVRDRVPGFRLGIARLRVIRSQRAPKHRRTMVP
jgi:O-antigen/teichoic acid export membrane protein